MNGAAEDRIRVLAVDPTTRGFAFAVLEGPQRLIDWGVRRVNVHQKNTATVDGVAALIRWYRPDALVIENCDPRESRRRARVYELSRDLRDLGLRQQLITHAVSGYVLRLACTGQRSATKEQVAATLAAQFPELARRVPPHRKPWMNEDPRINLFDAVGLAVAFYRRATSPAWQSIGDIAAQTELRDRRV